MSAEEADQISKSEFERLWATPVVVVGEVLSYAPGKGDALMYEYEGLAHLCSDSIAVIMVVDPEASVQKTLRVAVQRGDGVGAELLTKVGTKVRFSVPLLYLKHNPWGFVPFADLKRIEERTGTADDSAKDG